MYWQNLEMRALVQSTIDHENDTLFNSTIFNTPFSLCDKILLTDADFTNISWNGVWITIGVLLAVCLLSYRVEIQEWPLKNNVSLFDRELWNQLKITACRWIRILGRMRSEQRQDPPQELDIFPNQPQIAPEGRAR
jgi:hypothetical protein